jgi:DNA polymerase I-like protein with 3'-5' exonuclease and polymerase domains
MTSTATRNGTFPSDARTAAPFYLERGWLPVPNGYCTKRPTDPSTGKPMDEWEDLRPTPEDLDRLFPVGVPLNIGLILGEPSNGLVDADLDCQEATDAGPFFLPTTRMIHGRVGRPRSHHWYVVANPPEKASAKFKDLDGETLLELRSTGGQTVVPPSVWRDKEPPHRTEPVVWYSQGEPATVELDELRRALCLTASAALLARYWPKKGSRHDIALALSGGLLRGGMTVEQAERFMRAVGTAAKTGDTETKVRTVADTRGKLDAGENVVGWPTVVEILGTRGEEIVGRLRAWLSMKETPAGKGRAGASKRSIRPPEPYRPFPVHTLPNPVREFVIQAAAALGCDPAFIALPALAVVAGLIGNTRVIRLKRDWKEPAVVWSAVVASSGTLKSPAYHLALDYIVRLQRDLLKDHKQAMSLYEAEKQRRKDAGSGDGPLIEPVCRRVFCADITIEKLAAMLEDNPRGILVGRDELGAWLASFSRYKSKQGGTDLPNWLEMHRAGPIFYDRKTGPRSTVFVHRAAVSITGGIQPGTLARALTDEYQEAGLGPRIIMAMPTRLPKRWTETEVQQEVQEEYEKLVRRLLQLDFDVDKDGNPVPFALKLTSEAKEAFVRFYDEWALEQAGADGVLAATFAKLEAYAARFALMHHVVTGVTGRPCDDPLDLPPPDSSDPVTVESMNAGIELARWCAAEARRIQSFLTETEEGRQAHRLVEFLRSRGGRATPRELQRSCPSRYRSATEAELHLDALVGAGLAHWLEQPPGPKGGRPTRTCVLNPDAPTEAPEDPGEDAPTGEPPTPEFTKDRTDTTDITSAGAPTAGSDGVDTTPPRGSPTPEKPSDSRGCVSFGLCQQQESGVPGRTEAPEPSGRFCQRPENEGGVSPPYCLLTNPADLSTVQTALEESSVVGLDLETTGLDPRADRIRLLTLATERGTWLLDLFSIPTGAVRDLVFPLLAEPTVIGHNLTFDLGFLSPLGFQPVKVADTMLLSQLVHGTRHGRGFHGLGQCVGRELGQELPKDLQKSDWSGALSREQLEYAARDAALLPALHRRLMEQVKAGKQEKVAAIESHCLPAVAWMARMGIAFDAAAWKALAAEADADAERLARELDALAPHREQGEMFASGWNWSSPEQVKEAFALVGHKLDSTDDEALAKVHHPLAALLREYRAASKRAGTYGKDWTKHVASDGRVYAGWRQLGADSGRMACSSPNLQNLPRDPRYRACFRAPEGRVLVKADYSQIELRIAAVIAGDRAMMEAYRRGEDLHTQTARLLLGKEDVTKEDRQIAKSANFGLLYGMGAKGYCAYARTQYGLDMTQEQAAEYRRLFFAAYPGLSAWHRHVGRLGDGPTDTRTLTGRRRQNVKRFTEKLNTPVQGTGADGLKIALALLWECRGDCPGAFPVLAVHDEIVIEADAGRADAAAAWLKQAMLDGMAPLVAPVPVEVEVKVSRTWGGDV